MLHQKSFCLKTLRMCVIVGLIISAIGIAPAPVGAEIFEATYYREWRWDEHLDLILVEWCDDPAGDCYTVIGEV